MAIRYKLSNSAGVDGRIAYAELRGRHVCAPGTHGWIHFGKTYLKSIRETAAAGDPFVIYQALPRGGATVRQVITHVVQPTGEVALDFDPGNTHPHQMAVRVLARIKLPLLAPVPHPDGIGQKATTLPRTAKRIVDVLWRDGARDVTVIKIALGAPLRTFGGASVELAQLLDVLNNGHFELTPDAIDVLKAASEAGLNH
jgi:hypothetical protein